MNIFSFLWMSLVVILTISNIYIILKYFLDRFLLKENQKICFLPLIQFLVLIIWVFFDILSNFSKNYSSYELIKILSLSRIEPFLVIAFLASSLLIIFLFIVDLESDFISKNLNILVFSMLMAILFPTIIIGLENILFGETTPPFAVLHFERKIFFIYRVIVFPIIYLVSFILFWLISKRKIYDKNDYNNKRKKVNILKGFASYLYLIFVFGMIYLKLKYFDFYLYNSDAFLVQIVVNSYIFVLVYISISYYTSNKDNKNELFSNLFKKTFVLASFFPVSIMLAFREYYKLQELKINIIIIIITAILTAVITCIFNIYINRYFNSKY